MATFHYVYILVSEPDTTRHYTGLTTSLRHRLSAHNRGMVPHTAKFKPWCIDVVIAFRDRTKAVAFETYLKSHSGRALAQRFILSSPAPRMHFERMNPSLESGIVDC